MSDWLKILLIVLAAVIVLSVVMSFINRHFRAKYGLNLFYGGFLVLLAEGLTVGGIFLQKASPIGFALIAVGIILLLITLIYNIKRCGAAGIIATFLQLVFSLGCLFYLITFISNKGRLDYSMTSHNWKEEREVEKLRQRKGYNGGRNRYDDRDGF